MSSTVRAPSSSTPLPTNSLPQTATSSCAEEPQPELNSRLEAYTLKYKLGEGGFGKVYLAETVIDGECALVAIKAVKRVTRAGRMKSEVLSAEKRLMQLLSTEDEHGSFPHLIETFEDKHNAYFVSVNRLASSAITQSLMHHSLRNTSRGVRCWRR